MSYLKKFLKFLREHIVGICLILLGFFVGWISNILYPKCLNCDTYPFMVPELTKFEKKKIGRFSLYIILSFITFLISYSFFEKIYGYAIKYNVFKKEKKKIQS